MFLMHSSRWLTDKVCQVWLLICSLAVSILTVCHVCCVCRSGWFGCGSGKVVFCLGWFVVVVLYSETELSRCMLYVMTQQSRSYCYKGRCNSHNKQCQLLWGSSGHVSHHRCYDNFNILGTANGHCGFSWVDNKSFKKCDAR